MEPFITITINPPDELAQGYDPVEILTEFIRKFSEDPRMRQNKSGFVLMCKSDGSRVHLGIIWLTTNCILVHS